ncbi:hypothetical protein BDZ89DRAFT_1032911 [Hymenopellis radicata]|nr:hypothetical protein BDZ89DRAFT_1032911 [Hymenopellis radicata]
MAIIAFIHTIIITSVLFLLLAKIRNAHVKEDEESYIFKPSVWEPMYLPTALFFSQKAAIASPAPTIESPLPPLNPGATLSHPSLPPNIPASEDAEVSAPSTALVQSEDCLPFEASSQVNPAVVCAEDSETHAPVVRPQVSTAPIITYTPPTPKKTQAKKAKKNITELSTSASAPLLPLQTLTPDYYRVFTNRVKKNNPPSQTGHRQGEPRSTSSRGQAEILEKGKGATAQGVHSSGIPPRAALY